MIRLMRGRAFENILQVGNGVLELLDLLGALQNILAVQVTQLDLGHVLSLNLVNAEANHQVGDDLRFLSSVTHDSMALSMSSRIAFRPCSKCRRFSLPFKS